MNVFLRAKAWKLFIIMCGIPFGFQFILMGSFVSSNNPQLVFQLMPLVMILFMGVFVAWLWTLGTRLYQFAPEEIRTKPNKFKFGLVYASVYMLIFEGVFAYMAKGNDPSGYFAIIFPFHMLAMFFMFYAIYYIAKHLVMTEENRLVTFYNFSGPFFLLWFFPVGIWFIQPRINKLYSSHSQAQIQQN